MVELITVIVIVGILAVFAAPRFENNAVFAERSGRDKLVAGLQYARKAAIAQRHHVCVTVTAAGATFTVDTRAPETGGVVFCDGASSAPLPLPVPDAACGGAANAVCMPAGVAIAGAATFRFTPLGLASAAVVFTPTNQAAITVEPGTGYVH